MKLDLGISNLDNLRPHCLGENLNASNSLRNFPKDREEKISIFSMNPPPGFIFKTHKNFCLYCTDSLIKGILCSLSNTIWTLFSMLITLSTLDREREFMEEKWLLVAILTLCKTRPTVLLDKRYENIFPNKYGFSTNRYRYFSPIGIQNQSVCSIVF